MADEGIGSRLPTYLLVLSGVSTFAAVVVSSTSIWLQLKNYRKPYLQRQACLPLDQYFSSKALFVLYRMVVRIMVMVPLYAISSFIALFSLRAAFFIDAVRDIYEVSLTLSSSDYIKRSFTGIRDLLFLRTAALVSGR